jgi:hypothetical protein
MAKHCIYCKNEIPQESVLDVCKRCGHGVWGEKMYNAIVEGMQKASTDGNLMQGSVTQKFGK